MITPYRLLFRLVRLIRRDKDFYLCWNNMLITLLSGSLRRAQK